MRVAVVIDGDWLNKASANLGFTVDFKRFRESYFPDDGDTCLLEYFQIESIREGGVSQLRKLIDWLDCNGFRCKTIPVEVDVKNSIRDSRGELLVWMAVEIQKAAMRGADHIVLWTADRGLAPAIHAAQDAGAHVTLVTEKAHCPMVLMRAKDSLIDFIEMQADIEQLKKVEA